MLCPCRGADLDALDEATMRKCSDAIKGAVLQAAQENSDTSLKFLKVSSLCQMFVTEVNHLCIH